MALVTTPLDTTRYIIGIDGIQYKIIYRYDKLECRVNGLKTLYELRVGDQIRDVVSEDRVWQNTPYKVLKSVST